MLTQPKRIYVSCGTKICKFIPYQLRIGVPQGSTLGPLSYTPDFYDLFLQCGTFKFTAFGRRTFISGYVPPCSRGIRALSLPLPNSSNPFLHCTASWSCTTSCPAHFMVFFISNKIISQLVAFPKDARDCIWLPALTGNSYLGNLVKSWVHKIALLII